MQDWLIFLKKNLLKLKKFKITNQLSAVPEQVEHAESHGLQTNPYSFSTKKS